MTELRPLLAVVGLLVVAVAIVIWIARLRGWRVEWWERFLSPGGERGSRTAPGDSARKRAGRDGRRGSARSASSTETRPRRRDGAESGRHESGRGGTESGRQALIDLGDLPLFNPAGRVRADSLDREFDVGDLGALDTEPRDDVRSPSHAPSAPPADSAPARARANPQSVRERGRPDAPEPRRPEVNEEPRAERQAPSRSEGEGRELLVVLTVLTADERELPGSLVRDAFAALDLRPDEQGMFHHYGNQPGTANEPVFSVASVLEPGVFDLDTMDDLFTPGLYIFMRCPGPLPASVAFDLMLDVGTRLSRALEATLCDDQRCRLTVQATQALRERVIHFALRHERRMPDVR